MKVIKPENDLTVKEVIITLFILIFIAWNITTIGYWFFQPERSGYWTGYPKYTLADCYAMPFEKISYTFDEVIDHIHSLKIY